MEKKINKGGRPLKNEIEKKNKKIQIHISNKDYFEFVKKKPSNMSDSAFFSEIILSKKESISNLQNYYPLLMSINKIGNNTNQVAKKINSFGKLSDADMNYFFEKHNEFINNMNEFFADKK